MSRIRNWKPTVANNKMQTKEYDVWPNISKRIESKVREIFYTNLPPIFAKRSKKPETCSIFCQIVGFADLNMHPKDLEKIGQNCKKNYKTKPKTFLLQNIK